MWGGKSKRRTVIKVKRKCWLYCMLVDLWMNTDLLTWLILRLLLFCLRTVWPVDITQSWTVSNYLTSLSNRVDLVIVALGGLFSLCSGCYICSSKGRLFVVECGWPFTSARASLNVFFVSSAVNSPILISKLHVLVVGSSSEQIGDVIGS